MPQLGLRISWRERCKPGPGTELASHRNRFAQKPRKILFPQIADSVQAVLKVELPRMNYLWATQTHVSRVAAECTESERFVIAKVGIN
jgi:hypothetical protein